MRKQGRGKDPNYEYIFALYNSVRKYGVEIQWGQNFCRGPIQEHIIAIWVLVGKIFLWGPAGVSFSNFGTVRGPTQ